MKKIKQFIFGKVVQGSATIKPRGVNHTIVPQEFLINFPKWDEPKNNIIYV